MAPSRMRDLPGMLHLVPLLTEREQVGALVLGPKEPQEPFAEYELELIQVMSIQISSAIQALEQQEKSAREINEKIAEYREKERTLQLQFQQLLETHGDEKTGAPELDSERLVPLVEDGLRRLHDYAYLGEQELANLRLVTLRLEKGNNENATFIERGKALSAILVQALSRLRPEGKEPAKQGVPPKEWHPYIVLYNAYVLGQPNRDIMSWLYISQGTFNRTRRGALRVVAKSLEQMEQAIEKP